MNLKPGALNELEFVVVTALDDSPNPPVSTRDMTIDEIKDMCRKLKKELDDALEDACDRVQAALFPTHIPNGQHRYTTHFSEVRDAIMGEGDGH